jgi:hypothetical protein
MKGWPYYQISTLAMIPYMPNTPVYVDGMLSHFYYELKRLGRIEQTMCGDHFNHDKWSAFFAELKNVVQILCTVKPDSKLVPVGMSWVSNPRGVDGGRAVQCGFAFIKDGSSGTSDARNLARLALAYCFEDLRVDTIHGVQTVDNIAARNFSMRLGFKPVAVVPDYHAIDGKLVAAQVMMLRKADFWPGFLKWKELQSKVE